MVIRAIGDQDILTEVETLSSHSTVGPATVDIVTTVSSDIDIVWSLTEQAGEGVGLSSIDSGLLGCIKGSCIKLAWADNHLVVLGCRVCIHPVCRQSGTLGGKGEITRSAAILAQQGDGPVGIDGGILGLHTHGVRHVHSEVVTNADKRGYLGGPIRRFSIVSINRRTCRLTDAAREGGNLLSSEVVDGDCHTVVHGVDDDVTTSNADRGGDGDGGDGALVTLGGERRHADLTAMLVVRAVGHNDQLVVGGVGGEIREVDGRHTSICCAKSGGGLGGLIIYGIGGTFVARIGPAQRGAVAGDIRRRNRRSGDILTNRDSLDRNVINIPLVVGTIGATDIAEGNT